MNEMTLGQKIRSLRLTKQLTQKELAGDFITRNMLSQIENDAAMPSMKTMEYLAAKLEKPIGYFLDEQQEDLSLSQMISELVKMNEKKDYKGSVAIIEAHVKDNPSFVNNKVLKDLYINSYMYLGNQYMSEDHFEEAKECYLKLLMFENDMILTSDINLYKIYTQLSEAYTHLSQVEQAKMYHKKGQTLLKKMMAGREVQSLFMKLMEGDYTSLIASDEEIDPSGYDPYNFARYHMIIGSAYFNEQQYEKAIEYLEEALSFYKNKSRNTITSVIYEELSKCYSEIENYKKAYDYLQKARESRL